MIYTTLHRTLNIEQHKRGVCCSMSSLLFCRSLFVFSVVCVAQWLVFCVVFFRSLFVFSVVCVAQCLMFCSIDHCLLSVGFVLLNAPHWKQTMIYTTLHRTLNIEQHKPHWKQTMIYTTLYRTLGIEQHKPHWQQTMIYRTFCVDHCLFSVWFVLLNV
jgi:hypothetical protein